MSFQVSPTVRVVRYFRTAYHVCRAQWPRRTFICGLGLLAVGIVSAQPGSNFSQCQQPDGNTCPELDSYQLEQIQKMARENTERFRVRITLPQGAFASQSVSGLGGPAGHRRNESALTQIRSSGSVMLALKFLCIPLGLGVWFLIARKLAPELAESLTSWIPSRMLQPAVSTDKLVTLLAEEKAVLEFQAALGIGPGVAEELAAGQPAAESPFSPAAGYVQKVKCSSCCRKPVENVVPANRCRGFSDGRA